eukprot:702937-Amphidinium_carterae.3
MGKPQASEQSLSRPSREEHQVDSMKARHDMRSGSVHESHDPGSEPSLRPSSQVKVFCGIMSRNQKFARGPPRAVTAAAHHETQVACMNCMQHAPLVRHKNKALPMKLPLLLTEVAHKDNMSFMEVEMEVHKDTEEQKKGLEIVQLRHAARHTS